MIIQILIEGGLDDLEEELRDHFTKVVLVTANQLQSWGPDTIDRSGCDGEPDQNPCDVFAKELLECIQGVPVPRVSV